MKLGPTFQEQMQRLGSTWNQGEHVLVSGPTGSGKTALTRHIVQNRIDRGGHVVVMVGKLGRDETITRDYAGWTRWKTWKKKPAAWENRILLWPDTDKVRSIDGKRDLQKAVFSEAFDKLSNSGKWTLQIDEGLYTVSPSYLNLGNAVGMLHAMGRSSKLTIVTLTQRPSHLPLIVYSSAAHVFAGRMREEGDRKRLAELGGREGSRELVTKISGLGRHEFCWIPVAPDWPSEIVDMSV